MSCFSGLAGFIINDLNAPDLTTGQVISWLEVSLGDMNTLLGTRYSLQNGCPCPSLGISESGILAQMYKIKYYNQQVKENLGASAYDWSEIHEGDTKIRKVSRNEVAKTYTTLAKDAQTMLNDMIKYYRTNKAMPKSLSSFNTPFRMYYRIANGVNNTGEYCS